MQISKFLQYDSIILTQTFLHFHVTRVSPLPLVMLLALLYAVLIPDSHCIKLRKILLVLYKSYPQLGRLEFKKEIPRNLTAHSPPAIFNEADINVKQRKIGVALV